MEQLLSSKAEEKEYSLRGKCIKIERKWEGQRYPNAYYVLSSWKAFMNENYFFLTLHLLSSVTLVLQAIFKKKMGEGVSKGGQAFQGYITGYIKTF